MRHDRPPLRRQRGAALLLLLVVLGLGASSFLISMFSQPKGDWRRQALTRAALGDAREALIGYAIVHRRLPRPAISALDGRENTQPCTGEAGCTGWLPWTTLGLTPGDGWNKLLRYSVSPEFANGNLDTAVEATKTVLDRLNDGTVFYRVGSANCRYDDRCAPAVILASGRRLGTSITGIEQADADTDNQDEQANQDAVREFMARADTDDVRAIGGSFGNVVGWVPLQLIRTRIRATAPNPNLPR
jgi:type II secretory pathway pseudopilin PulG